MLKYHHSHHHKRLDLALQMAGRGKKDRSSQAPVGEGEACNFGAFSLCINEIGNEVSELKHTDHSLLPRRIYDEPLLFFNAGM